MHCVVSRPDDVHRVDVLRRLLCSTLERAGFCGLKFVAGGGHSTKVLATREGVSTEFEMHALVGSELVRGGVIHNEAQNEEMSCGSPSGGDDDSSCRANGLVSGAGATVHGLEVVGSQSICFVEMSWHVNGTRVQL